MAIETGLSDFLQMSAAVTKMYYAKQKPSIVHYHQFKNVCNHSFIQNLEIFLLKLM